MRERPFLTARWTDLVLLNFVVPPELIARLAPTGTEPDLFDGVAYASVVGFRFSNVRIFGIPIPGHTTFDEVNLRYYVKRSMGDEVRRGVVFVREIVPRRAVSIIANCFYNESYTTRPMRSTLTKRGAVLETDDTLEYTWQSRKPTKNGGPIPLAVAEGSPQAAPISNSPPGHCSIKRWNTLGASVASPLSLPPRNSLYEFIVEHYYGYTRGRDGGAREYRVAHAPWRVAAAANIVWSCDLATTYGEPFAKYLSVAPVNALIAEGSDVQVFRGRRLDYGRVPLARRDHMGLSVVRKP